MTNWKTCVGSDRSVTCVHRDLQQHWKRRTHASPEDPTSISHFVHRFPRLPVIPPPLSPKYRSFPTKVSQLKIRNFFHEKRFNVLKCYNFLWVQKRDNCSPAASFANCIMTVYLLKVHLQTFLSTPLTQKCQILSCNTLVANERYLPQYPIIELPLPMFFP
jgi:hypothetical protein